MKTSLGLCIVLYLSVAAFADDDDSEGSGGGNCYCPRWRWTPVCGANERTYANSQCALCETQIACNGECPCPGGGEEEEEECSNCAFVSYNPVCTDGNVQYNNACEAECEEAEILCYHQCPCEQGAECGCQNAYRSPVCSDENVQYDSQCAADCEEAEIACFHACPCDPGEACNCNPYDYSPVCTEGDVEYKNRCAADCDDADIECYHECPCDGSGGGSGGGGAQCTHCSNVYNPVCGSDDQVHINSCVAECKGADVECTGTMCPCPDD